MSKPMAADVEHLLHFNLSYKEPPEVVTFQSDTQ